MRSIIFSLIDPVACCVLNRALPNNAIKFFGRETQNPISFPGWPSFGDVLCNGASRSLVGLTFHVPIEHYLTAEKMAKTLSPAIATLKRFKSSSNLGVYEAFPCSSWLEIKWSSIEPDKLIDIQTSDVLWYNDSNLSQPIPIALGIEHLENLAKEADYDLIMPERFPFQQLALEILND